MRILFCNYEYPPLGGGGVVMAALARELARRHSVTVLTSRALDLAAEDIDGGVRVVRVPVFFRDQLAVANFPSMLAYLPMAALRGLRLRGRTRSDRTRPGRTPPDAQGFDVINTHFVVPTGPVGHALGRLYGVPNVLSVHGGDLYDPSKASSPHRHAWLRPPIRYLLAKADALVGQSNNTLQHVSDFYDVERRTELIPLGIERPPVIDHPARAAFGVPQDALLMVTVGRVVRRKATPQLVEALAAAQRANAHLLIIGDGPEVGPTRAAAAAAGMSARVHFLGQVTERRKFEALAASDIFVSASQHEGFGLVFLEAMAYGLPIVCYDHGGQTDFLASGETGFVVKLNDLTGFTAALQKLCDQPELRSGMAANNRRRVENFIIDKCAERYETVFEDALRNFAQRGR